jgi:outer membrane protein assembly factor BamB
VSRLVRFMVVLSLFVLTPSAASAGTGGQLGPTGTVSSEFHINASHNGVQTDPLVPPLHELWSVPIQTDPYGISYAIIAAGFVFVEVAGPTGGSNVLYAFHRSTGERAWGPVPVAPSSYDVNMLAYANGRVFVVDRFPADLSLKAFGIYRGKLLWQAPLPAHSSYPAPPTAWGGGEYVNGSDAVVAYNQWGGRRWVLDDLPGIIYATPAVSRRGVFVNYPAGHADRLRRSDGGIVWHRDPFGDGGGSIPGVLYQGRFFTESPWKILDAVTGRQLRSYYSFRTPTFYRSVVISSHHCCSEPGQGVSGRDLATGDLRWNMRTHHRFVWADPVVDGDFLYLGLDDGTLAAFRPLTGEQVWETDTGSVVSAIAAGDGIIVVTNNDGLVAYG